jgi:hypothetical protein
VDLRIFVKGRRERRAVGGSHARHDCGGGGGSGGVAWDDGVERGTTTCESGVASRRIAPKYDSKLHRSVIQRNWAGRSGCSCSQVRSFIDYLTTVLARWSAWCRLALGCMPTSSLRGSRLPGASTICIHTLKCRCRLDGRRDDDTSTAAAMDDEGESPGPAQRRRADSPERADADEAMGDSDAEERQRLGEQLARERRLDAKRKRIRMLNELLRELDLTVYMQLITVYYLEYAHPPPALAPSCNNTALIPSAAAPSSGWRSKPSSTPVCSHPWPTRWASARPTSPSRFCP